MKYVLVTLLLLLIPVFNAHRLLGSLAEDFGDITPIENHMSDNALHDLESVVEDASVRSSGGLMGQIRQFFHVLLGKVD